MGTNSIFSFLVFGIYLIITLSIVAPGFLVVWGLIGIPKKRKGSLGLVIIGTIWLVLSIATIGIFRRFGWIPDF